MYLLLLGRVEGREKEKSIHVREERQSTASCTHTLTGDQAGNLLLHRTELNQRSHVSQGLATFTKLLCWMVSGGLANANIIF